MMSRPAIALFIAALLVPSAGTSATDVPQYLEVRPGCLVTGQGPIPLALEHATTPRQRQIGLMERTELPPGRGMVFFYEERRPASAGFWMYRTRIPLDIAWLDDNGAILVIDTMTPCDSDQPGSCPAWSPGQPHKAVLELPAGFFESHNVTAGDRLVINLNDSEACSLVSPETPPSDPLD